MKRNLRNKMTIDPGPLIRIARKRWRIYIVGRRLMVAMVLMLLAACTTKESSHEHNRYTCPMHPTIVSDRPGTCPVCGMDLVPQGGAGGEVKITEDLAALLKSPSEAVVSSIETIKAEFSTLPLAVEATGVITYDTRKIFSIPARVAGRIEKLYLKYRFQQVRKGQKVAEIYSPELVTAQRELLYLLKNDPDNTRLVGAAKHKLQLLGLAPSQISALIKGGQVDNSFVIHSPYDGYLVTENATSRSPETTPPSSPTTGGAMGGAAATSSMINSPADNAPVLKEGQYVSAGQTLFKVVSTNALRIELDVRGSQGGAVKAGDEIELVFNNGEKERASVDLVQPFYNEGETFIKVRVITNKTSGLVIGELVKASINVRGKESLWLPRAAVLDLGTRKVVFVKEGQLLKPKSITTGIRSDNRVEVTSGLSTSEEVAANAHYLVDSDSFIKIRE